MKGKARAAAVLTFGLLTTSGAAARTDDLAMLGDEFDSAASLAKWKNFDTVFGWPDRLKQVDVDQTTEGALAIQPYHSAWVRDRNAAFIYQEVAGDFDVRARVRVRGARSSKPSGTWSLGGLFARFPNGNDAKTWTPFRENWHFITTGIAQEPGLTVTETKGTFNSNSSLKLRPFAEGWIELRLVRVGMMHFALARVDGEKQWHVRDRFYRMDPRPTMQVGFVAYTTSAARPDEREVPDVQNRTVETELPVDMILDVDWVRFSRPKVQVPSDWLEQVSRHPLADGSVTDAELLARLGD